MSVPWLRRNKSVRFTGRIPETVPRGRGFGPNSRLERSARGNRAFLARKNRTSREQLCAAPSKTDLLTMGDVHLPFNYLLGARLPPSLAKLGALCVEGI